MCGQPDKTISNVNSNTATATHLYSLGSFSPIFLAQLSDGSFKVSLNPLIIGVSNSSLRFHPASTANSLFFLNKIWVINVGSRIDDALPIYSSTDGQTWLPTANVPSVTINGQVINSYYVYSFALFQNQLWITPLYVQYINGEVQSQTTKIFHSSDGINWTEAQPPLLSSAISLYVSNSKLWLMGTTGGSVRLFYSSDGVNWTEANDIGSDYFTQYLMLGSFHVYFQNKLWAVNRSLEVNPSSLMYSSTDDGRHWIESASPSVTTGLDQYGRIRDIDYGSLVVFTDSVTGVQKLWFIATFSTSSTTPPTTEVYSSIDGVAWQHMSTLPVTLNYLSSVVFQNKLYIIGADNLSGNAVVFSSSDGQNWNSEIMPCTGSVTLSLSTQSVNPDSLVNFTVGGLTNCGGQTVKIYSPTKPSTTLDSGVVASCVVSSVTGAGCSGSALNFNSPSDAGIYPYYAAIDINNNLYYTNNGEVSLPASLTVTGNGGAGGGGAGGNTGGATGGGTLGCGDVGAANNRATGLVSAPQFDPSTKFNTSGGCVQDPKAAFVPYKIPTFEDLKSLYYTQK